MTSSPLHIVWFKRDLRVADHAPLAAAVQAGNPVLPLYVVEPGLWARHDASARQWAFVHAALEELRRSLGELGQPLVVRQGDTVAVLRDWLAAYRVQAVHSHQETGNAWTYERDQAVAALLREAGVPWHQYRQHGVVRPLQRRDGWARQWEALMGAERASVPVAVPPVAGVEPGAIPTTPATPEPLPADPGERCQPGGRRAGEAVLNGFLGRRGQAYSGGISAPGSAWLASSRLSPHLAQGTLSLREVVQASRARRDSLREGPRSRERGQWLRSLQRFEQRLHWHCHFMQKLESEPRFEFENMQSHCDGLREGEFDTSLFTAWCRGETGFPLIDACMRQLRARGWLNFRMRALLVSFASYHLWLDWKGTGPFLARCFTDYEPGIHFCQLQMQSGTTGINTLRIYNPVKQSQEHDPDGVFIRQWLPELAAVPTTWLHQPWLMSAGLQDQAGCRIGCDYPEPVVDHQQAARVARERFRRIRRNPDARAEADQIQQRHGSRRGRPQKTAAARRGDDRQRSLFDDDG